jgi:cytoskeleton protein RodZ
MQTIGERLEDARKRKGISIREAAEATKIRGDYLQKFESNHFDIGLTTIYIRGFLHNYAEFLKLPADRIVSDFESLGHSDTRPRQPSREVYGRMDVSVVSADDRNDRAPAPTAEPLPPAEAGRGPGHSQRARSHASPGLQIDPALVFKGGIALAALLGVAVLIWVGKMVFGGGEAREPAREAAAAPLVQPAEPAAVVTFSASKPVKIKVVRQSDNFELYQGTLQAGDHFDAPDVPLLLSASEIENVGIDYKGKHYLIGDPNTYRGYKTRVPVHTPF